MKLHLLPDPLSMVHGTELGAPLRNPLRVELAEPRAPTPVDDTLVKARAPRQDASVNQRRRQVPRHDAKASHEKPDAGREVVGLAGGNDVRLHATSPARLKRHVEIIRDDEAWPSFPQPKPAEPPENRKQALLRRNSIALSPEAMDWECKREVGLEDDFDRLGNHVRPGTVEKLAEITDVRNRLNTRRPSRPSPAVPPR